MTSFNMNRSFELDPLLVRITEKMNQNMMEPPLLRGYTTDMNIIYSQSKKRSSKVVNKILIGR